MKQEDEELLIKDLYSRLLYEVECKDIYINVSGKLTEISTRYNMCRLSDVYGELKTCYIPNCRPYLFPMSSLTEEQLYELKEMFGFEIEFSNQSIFHHGCFGYLEMDILFEWLNKNHFDYRGLIEKGLAMDATNKNIYIMHENKELLPNNPKITIGTKIRSKTNPDIILSIISDDSHGDEFECSNGSVVSLKQIEKFYNIII